ncbi:class I SAM-dependent methyltransferase [Pseudactinotalea terrae]|uniref:class I SAM-dependent methyltransferase n=1 Tax=Pseudactinotalea terrae TaxID=1743262 RepID=UPI0012E0FB81|nr:class I SAM-dependent methyltransferase [Pseudactinotalea terrae]
MVEKSLWTRQVERNPEHSHWYVQRFKEMAAAGQDLHGEARFVDAMVGRSARILDAGCGPGRLGGELARRGHHVVGVDVDPVLIQEAQAEHPDATWLTQDLAELDLHGAGVREPFDVIVSAGNVMTFLAPSTRRLVLANLAGVLADDGRLVAGFGAGRGYEFDEFYTDARESGLALDLTLSTWDLRPFDPTSDFLVAILRRSVG